MSSRPKRQTSSRRQNAVNALRRAKEARERGLSRAQQLEESSDEDDLYVAMDEEDYRRTVAERRRQNQNFVVGDASLGYHDDGEDHFSEEEEIERREASQKSSKSKSGKKKKRGADSKAQKKEKKHKKSRLLSMMSSKTNSNVKKPKPKRVPVENKKDILASILNDIDGEDESEEEEEVDFSEHMASTSDHNDFGFGDFNNEPSGVYPRRAGSKSNKENSNVSTKPKIGSPAPTPPPPTSPPTSPPPASPPPVSPPASPPLSVPALTSPPDVDQDDMEDAPPPSNHEPDTDTTRSSSLATQRHPKKQKLDVPVRENIKPKIPEKVPNEKDSNASSEEKSSKMEFGDDKEPVLDWRALQNMAATESSSQQISSSSLDGLVRDGKMLMYWFDAYEDPYNSPGTVWLFGKALVPGQTRPDEPPVTVSCCVAVRNLERNIFVLPREFKLRDERDSKSATDEKVEMPDVYNELNGIFTRRGIKEWKTKPVTRKYAFELRKDGVPFETEYMKVVYPFKDGRIPRNTTGKTFSHMFGTQSSALELFVLKRRLMGPCWLLLEDVTRAKVNQSWCKREFVVESQKQIQVLPQKDAPPVPTFSVMSIYFRHVINPKTKGKEIAMISAVIHRSVDIHNATKDEKPQAHFTCIRPLRGQALPYDMRQKIAQQKMNVKLCGSEREMLNFFLAQIHSYDPDVLLGHNMHKYKLEMLLARFQAEKVSHWSKIGRLRKTKFPKLNRAAEYGGACGRILCDTLTSSMELLREKTYTLDHLVKSRLNVKDRREIDVHETRLKFGSSKDILSLVMSCWYDAVLQLRLMFKLAILPLTRQLTELCGNLWNRSLMSRRAERNEYVLLHEFHKLKYVLPEKYTSNERKARSGTTAAPKSSKRKKAAYAGGLVLEPKKGFYDKFVLLLDFNSLYPSIIREWNICFSTVKHWGLPDDDALPETPEKGEDGVLPKVIGHFLQRRKVVKDMLKNEKNPERRASYDIRQKALKLVANSMYGCLGFDSSRFYCKPMAALITALGRESLTNAKKAAESLDTAEPIEVIYGDTDSIMVHTGTDDFKDAKKVANEVKKVVNKGYKFMYLELDAVYKCILLLRKKKYAAVPIIEENGVLVAQERELKGLDVVRRDWCNLSKDVSRFVLDELLSSKSREHAVENIHEYLGKLKIEIDGGKIPKGKYIITKGLTKPPEDYADSKQFAHVTVALQLRQEGKIVNAGDHIPYIITEGSGSQAERAVHASKILKQNLKNTPQEQLLKIDTNWYISHQILPPVARLCDVISETSPGQIAEQLGLDPKRFTHDTGVTQNNDEEDEIDMQGVSESDEAERYVDRRPEDAFQVSCPYCFTSKRPFRDIFNLSVDGQFMLVCEDSNCRGRDAQNGGVLQSRRDVNRMKNSITLQLRAFVQKYYDHEAQCDDPTCRSKTRACPTNVCNQTGCQGRMIPLYSAKDLYEQLCYYKWIFHLGYAMKRVEMEQAKRADAHVVKVQSDPKAQLVQLKNPELGDHVKTRLNELKEFVESAIKSSAYYYVDTKDLFSMFIE